MSELFPPVDAWFKFTSLAVLFAHAVLPILKTNHNLTEIALSKASEYHLGTRAWIFDKLNAWHADPSPKRSQVFALLGAAGVGKSVALAELTRLGGAITVQGRDTATTPWTDTVAALHFFQLVYPPPPSSSSLPLSKLRTKQNV